MKVLGNILWLLLAGIWLFIAYVIAGIINCLFIITIPFGIQSFKLASFVLWPFGRVVVDRPGASVVASGCGNIIWILTGGIWLAIAHFITGLLLCLTVIGIPFGIQCFKLAGLALTPFGKRIVPASARNPGVFVATGPTGGTPPPLLPPPPPPAAH